VREGSVLLTLEVQGGESKENVAPAPASQAPAAPENEAKAPAPTAADAPAPQAPAPQAGPEMLEVRVPDIGDFHDVAVIEMLVAVGDTVTLEQSLFTVESDKASMEIPSSAEGTVKELRVAIGDKLNAGDLVAIVE